jgi:hypothetical protein
VPLGNASRRCDRTTERTSAVPSTQPERGLDGTVEGRADLVRLISNPGPGSCEKPPLKRQPSRHERERIHVTGPNDCEVPTIERRDLANVQSFGCGDD